VKDKADAVLRLADPLAGTLNPETVELATRHRLPTMLRTRLEVEAGGLMSYYPNTQDYYRQAASYVDISKRVGRVNRESIVIDAVAA
jgi:putative tryptophan/tyrosine transport system substrate-binding protein